MRLNYSDEEDFPGQFELWQANCERSLKGKAGQQALRDLEAALLALPEKRLIHGLLEDETGGVCVVGAYARYKGLDLSTFDPEDETADEVGVKAGMPPLVAWKIVELNDVTFGDIRYYEEQPSWHAVKRTPEKRYEQLLWWVQSQLR